MQLAIHVSIVLAVLTAPVGGAVPNSALTHAETPQLQDSELDADRVLLRFDVRDDGSATASVEYRFMLNRSNRTGAFETLQRDIETNRSAYLDRFERRIGQTVRSANNATPRVMRVQNVTVRAQTRQLPRPYGVVTYSYTWHGFAAIDNGRISIGNTLGGLHLDDGSRLQISWPDGYHTKTVHESASEARDQSVIWTGPTWFDREGPRVVLARDGIWNGTAPVALFVAGLVCLMSGAVFWWHSAGRPLKWLPMNEPTDDHTSDTDKAESIAPTTQEMDPALMSNEERILWEIEQRGGRVKQQELVATLGWSDSKVSRSVSTLRDSGEIERFRLGNENVLTVDGADGSESS